MHLSHTGKEEDINVDVSEVSSFWAALTLVLDKHVGKAQGHKVNQCFKQVPSCSLPSHPLLTRLCLLIHALMYIYICIYTPAYMYIW